MRYKDHYPALRHLLQGYLNEDWPDEYGDPSRAVEDFLSGEPELAGRLEGDIWNALVSSSDEAELESLVVLELGSGYFPPGEGLTFQDWLIAVARRVRRFDPSID